MGLKKDYIAIVSSSWDIFKKIDRYIMDPNEYTDRQVKELNIDTIDSVDGIAYSEIADYLEDLY